MNLYKKTIKALNEGGVSCLIKRTFRKLRDLYLFSFPEKYSTNDLFGKSFIMQRSQFRINSNQIITNNEYHVELIKDSDVVIDAGANAGIFSVFAAIKHPEATIYAFEPTPFTFDILKKNTQYYPNIRCFNAALGDKCGPTTIVEAPRPTMNFVGVGGIPIEMRTIDSLGIPLNFLKMDTEGYEANILKGATETIRKYKPIIAMSAYHKPEDKVELPKLLNSISPYDCELRHDCEEEFICKPL